MTEDNKPMVFNLKKKLEFRLEKAGVSKDIITRVGFLMDTSGSMVETYRSGKMNYLIERLLPVAHRFDDNGTMEVFAFSTEAYKLPDMTLENYEGYVQKNIMASWDYLRGMTNYSEGIKAFIDEWSSRKGFFGTLKSLMTKSDSKEENIPGFIILQTDGDNQDIAQTKRTIKLLKEKNIFLTIVYTSRQKVPQHVLNYETSSENVSLIYIQDLDKINDDQLYDRLVNPKFVSWLKTVSTTV